MIDGICCNYCKKFESSECPIVTANNWSKWKNFCSEFRDVNGNVKIMGINTKSKKLTPISNLPF